MSPRISDESRPDAPALGVITMAVSLHSSCPGLEGQDGSSMGLRV